MLELKDITLSFNRGTPEEICQCEASYTGQYLAPVLQKSRRVETEE